MTDMYTECSLNNDSRNRKIMVRCKVLSVRKGRRDCINDVLNETKGMAIKHLMNFKSYSGPLGLTKEVSAVVIGKVLRS